MGFHWHPICVAGRHATLRLSQHHLGRLSRQKGELGCLLGELSCLLSLLFLWGDNKQGNELKTLYKYDDSERKSDNG